MEHSTGKEQRVLEIRKSEFSTGMDVFGKKVLVVGLGKSGLSASRWLSRQGAHVTVSELKVEDDLDRELLKETWELGIELEAGGHRKDTDRKSVV